VTGVRRPSYIIEMRVSAGRKARRFEDDRCWQIVLQKSPSGLCEIEICNYRIGAPVLLNRRCAFQPDLESIFLAEMLNCTRMWMPASSES
jgi:hypothetical protein